MVDLPGPRQKAFAGDRQFDMACAVEKGNTQNAFQRLDLATNCGLRDIAAFGRLLEASGFSNGEKGLNLFETHDEFPDNC